MKKNRLLYLFFRQWALPTHSLSVKLFFVVTVFFSLPVFSSVYSQTGNINLEMKDTNVETIIKQLRQQSGFKFMFSHEDLKAVGNKSIKLNNSRIEEAMDAILQETHLTYEIRQDIIIIRPRNNIEKAATPQGQVVSGKVTDQSGQIIPGVTILIKGTSLGTSTNEKGEFSLTLPETQNIILIYSFVGMEKKEVTWKGEKTLNIVLEENTKALDEVVVTGMFNRKKEGFTGSATKVTGEEIKRMTSGNVLKAIEMIDPGFRMNVSNMAGANPSAIPGFQMRGQASMGDYSADDVVFMRGDIDTRPNQPLFVLDGIIGVSVTKIIDLDPEQVESITLLKDAAAMVIYGSQASNGVVVVETKAPAAGKLRVSYNGNYKLQAPDLSVYNLLEARDKLELEKRAGFYDEGYNAESTSTSLRQYTNKLTEIERGVNTYWLAQPVRTAFSHRHGVNLEGGDQSLRYKIYFGLNSQPGVMKGTDLTGKSGSIDIRYRYKGLLISNQLYVDYVTSERTSPYGSFSTYGTLNPYYRLYDENGNIAKVLEYNYDFNGNKTTPALFNPMYNILFQQKDRNSSFEIRDAFKVEYRPIENLSLAFDASISKINSDVDVFKPSSHTDFYKEELSKKGDYNWNNTKMTNYNVSFTANYNKAWDKHLLSLFARYSVEERNNHYANVSMTGFPNDVMDEIFLGTTMDKVTGSEGISRALGFVSTINYSYDQRYAVDFSIRVDASSEFGKNNRYAPFWSTGLRWNIDKESLIRNTGIFDELVLRATYGVTGSQGFSPYQSLQMYTYDGMLQAYHSSDVIGAKLQSMGNPNLKWQKTDSYNIGLDFNMLNRIVSGRLEYYYKYTRNTLLDFSLPPSMGFSTIPENMGNISNKGVEATLRLMPYNNLKQRLNFNIILTGSHNKNEIKQISNALKIKNAESIEKTASRPLPRYEEGSSQSMIWVVRSLGIDPMTGREIFLKRNGQVTNIYDGTDQIPYGDTEPKLRGSLSFNLNWKGLSLSVAGQYHFGGQIYNRTLVDKVENANLRYNVDKRAFTDRWEKPGDIAFFKGTSQSANGSQTKASSRFVMDNNELTINTINLQYRFEQRYNKFIRKMGMSSASVGLYLEDIARFSTVKMERGIDYPFARQVSMSLNVVF